MSAQNKKNDILLSIIRLWKLDIFLTTKKYFERYSNKNLSKNIEKSN